MVLTDAQQAALDELRLITAGAQDPDRELSVLESVGWNVEKAAQTLFEIEDTSGPSSSSSSQAGPSRPSQSDGPASTDDVDVDDTESPSSALLGSSSSSRAGNVPLNRRVNANPGTVGLNLSKNLLSLITFPFALFGGILSFVFRLLRLPFGGSLRRQIGGSNGSRPTNEDPTSAVERWVRELEDEVGGMSVSRRAASSSEGDQGESVGQEKVVLPDFFVGSYQAALKAAETELRVLCVILTSSEHDDTPVFRRTVLTDSQFVRTLTDNDILVWAGDIRDREAYSVSLKLAVTTYPFVAFIALHNAPNRPSASSAPSSGGPRLAVLSRLEGPPTSITSAPALTSYITSTLLPRVTPLLSRLRTQRWEREQERALREEQDRAFQEAARRDREKVEKKMEEERLEKELAAAKAREAEEAETKAANRLHWRRYARRKIVLPESGTLRVGTRLADGRRAVRRFDAQWDVEQLYAYVETLLIPEGEGGEDPEVPPAGYEHEWSFTLVSSFPRAEIPSARGTLLGEVDSLKGGANLVVEMKPGMVASSTDDDGESDEEDED